MKPEAIFQQQLEKIAPLYKCVVIDIPDVIPIMRGGFTPIAKKRPFDCILVMWRQNYCLELKINYGKLLPHQEETMQKINTINSSYFVVRKKVYAKTRKAVYTIEQNYPYSTFPILSCIFKTEKIEKLFDFFQDPCEYISQKLMLDNLVPTKKKPKLRKVRL